MRNTNGRDINFKDLEPIDNFLKERSSLDAIIDKINSLVYRGNLCAYIAQVYKTYSLVCNDNRLKRIAAEEGTYFLHKGLGYVNEYQKRKQMLPDVFDVDKP